MDLKLQAKLLRVLQERLFRRVGGTLDITSDVRVVAATNSDLKEKVRQGKFREDLYHRLCAVEIEVPPLRERAEDILEMAAQFAERSFRARGKRFVGFESEAEVALRLYTWPGNVRELLNAIERAALLASEGGRVPLRALSIPGGVSFAPRGPDGTPGRAHLTLVQGEGGEPGAAEVPTSGYMELKKKWSDSFEKEYLMAALIRHHGNVSSAAREAHLDRSNFLRLLRRHHIQAAEFRKPGVGGEPEADEVAKAA
jgi:transcriptional regulator with GAF, ATPase, and Fis domain